MNRFFALAAALILGFALNINAAEARRFGGGGSTGIKRSVTPPPQRNAAPQTPSQQQAAPGGNAQTPPKSSWTGPIAGLAAGLGLAALASHLGFGEGLANVMTIALLVFIVIAAIAFFKRKQAAAQGQGMRYAGAGADYGGQSGSTVRPDFAPAGGPTSFNSAPAASNLPADFDAAGFARNAKVNFIRLQAANDAGNLDDIREFTSPEMFAEIKLAIDERQGASQETDVVQLDAEVIDVTEEANRYIVSVHFSGQIREQRNGPVEAFAEIWHMTKPTDGSRGWVIAGIQQTQ
ncbi:MAG: 39S ribosomal protein L45 [Azonexus sp.]|jgi:predicted lipid-binding transport protein (Tim44 family)|nr:39S ribosomal protein L45 [Azonexus sp.]